MAHHKSAKKRIRQAEKRRIHNKYYAKTTRNAIKKLRLMTDHGEASKYLPEVIGMVDRLAKRNIIHRSNADNKKSKLAKFVNSLQAA